MKEFIEIPFGTKDGELEGWEYNIPEGYTASIENGKIIVKKENKDERMCNAAIRACQYMVEHFENSTKDYEDAITWLEKKGEQKSAWREDDENRFNNLKWLVECSNESRATKEGFIKFINNLKSLKGRVKPHWKPSEEHIRYLQAVVNDVHNIGSESCCIALRDLLEQLKSL